MRKRLTVVALATVLVASLAAIPAEAQQAKSGTITAQVTRNSTSFKAWFSAGFYWDVFQSGCMIYLYREGRQVMNKSCTGWNNGSIAYPARGDLPCYLLEAYFTGRNRSGYSYSGWLNAC